jgi:steroid delta-isomerase-like uncharacterized protein
MAAEQNKAIVRRIYEEMFIKRNMHIVDELVAADYVDHNAPPGLPRGREGLKQQATLYLTAFPDMRMTFEDMIAEGDKVITRWAVKGTHKGDLMGIPATNKQVAISGIAIDCIANGKAVEHWEIFDQLGMMQQLGVIPTP